MNIKTIFYLTGKILQIVSLLLVLPIIVAVIYGESTALITFTAVLLGSFGLGTALVLSCKTKNVSFYAKEGFILVALVWITVSVIGALPFVISREIPSFIDAFFETVSGFTTTGASILDDVEALSKSMLFWRSFTHFIGGMGVLVFVMAIIPTASDKSIHILRAEMPGPTVDKIVPRAKQTARILYLIYIAMTILEIVLLYIFGMPVFDSFVISFGTAGTGGFGILSSSAASYPAVCKWIIGSFMVLFGINFNIYYLLLIKKAKSAFKSTELWTYLGIVAVSTALITVNTLEISETGYKALENSFFQVSSIISTTGYSTTNFDLWPTFSKTILLLLMITGACGGSTAGGIKVSRVVLVFKIISRKLKTLIHPRTITPIKSDGKIVEEETVTSTGIYTVVYFVCIFLIFFLISFENKSIETNLSATLACFNNIGPGLDGVGPLASYSSYTDFSKIILSFAMLMGRLEIFPILIFLSPKSWRKGG